MVVFNLNGWTIEKDIDAPYNFGISHIKPLMWVRHACSPHIDGRELAVTKVFVYPESSQACWRCTTPIPEGITALYLLHEWDTP